MSNFCRKFFVAALVVPAMLVAVGGCGRVEMHINAYQSDVLPFPDARGVNSVAIVAGSEGEDEMLAMIQDLPVGYRTVFNLYALEGYSHKEIAELLEININTSKSQLSRARSLLQNKLLEKERLF